MPTSCSDGPEARRPVDQQLDAWRKGAEAGDAESQFKLARAYHRGESVPKDSVKALEWYQRAAAQGRADAQVALGQMHLLGEGVSKDLSKAFDWFQKAAAQGHGAAQFELGRMYAAGEGVSKDLSKALEWYQKAAGQGHKEAQFAVGYMYFFGKGVPKDPGKAFQWIQKAAAQGLASAQSVLGSMYLVGIGVPKDLGRALEWYEKAAAQGNGAAQVRLGRMYAAGEGVSKDLSKAVEWYQKAAAQGEADGQLALAVMYHFGAGIPKDLAKAFDWCQKAAALGLADAQSWVGWMYETGQGTDRDWVLAYAWYNLAAAQGHDYGRTSRDRLELRLKPHELSEAQSLASGWRRGAGLARLGETSPGDITSGRPLTKYAAGTGFLVSGQGHALTNQHLVEGCKELRSSNRAGAVKVITTDPANDLALLQLSGGVSDVALIAPDWAQVRQGQEIVVFGYPLENLLSSGGNATHGTVSALTGLADNTSQIQITAPVQLGSSGSPVLDRKGHVVGVVSQILADPAMAKIAGIVPQNVNFAVSGRTVLAFLDAHRVPYKTGRRLLARDESVADLADEARKWTLMIECWK